MGTDPLRGLEVRHVACPKRAVKAPVLFEARVAQLLGKERALLLPSETMASCARTFSRHTLLFALQDSGYIRRSYSPGSGDLKRLLAGADRALSGAPGWPLVRFRVRPGSPLAPDGP